VDSLHAIIFGLVEGVTEFLPISSTGHLILTGRLLGLDQTAFLKSFEIVIQLGAILSVVVLYWRQLLVNREIMKRVMVAFVPTAILGFALYKVIKTYLLSSDVVVLVSLFLGGIFLIIFECNHKEKKEEAIDDMARIPYSTSALIGLFQAVAMVPGISRSASTIVGGLVLGLNRKTVVEFSFLLAVPTMLAASALDLMKSAGEFSMGQVHFLSIGFVVSFFAAMAAIKGLLSFVRNHTFIPFGVYRIILVVLFWYVMYFR